MTGANSGEFGEEFAEAAQALGQLRGRAGIGDAQRARLAEGRARHAGSAFGEPRALRISYTCPTAQLPEGLRRFREFFAELA